MRCKQVEKHVDPLVDGWLHGRLLSRIMAHLARCEPCRRVVRELRRLNALVLRTVTAEPVPPDLHRRCLDRIRSA